MGDFEQKVINAVNEKLTDGTVEKLVQQYVEKSVTESLASVFGYSGKGKKMIEAKLNEVIVPVIERHDFNKYLVKLDEILTEIVNSTNLKENKAILCNFQELMTEPEFKEIKLSEIFKKYCNYVAAYVDTKYLNACCEDGEPYYQHVRANMEVEHEDKAWYISRYDNCCVKFSCEEDEQLNLQIKLYKNHDNDVWSILHGGLEEVDINSLRNLSEFEVFLSVLKRGFVKIIMDTENECDDDIEPDEKPEWSLS